MNNAYILVVDDEPDICTLVQDILEDEGYAVATASNLAQAREQRRLRRPDLILLDIWLPDGDGIQLLKEWHDAGGLPCPVVIMSGHGSVENAVEATRLGAYDFLEKPLSLAKLTLTIQRALQADQLVKENLGLRRQFEKNAHPVGDSHIMHSLREQAQRIAQHDTWVLMTGEAGVGKQTFARYLHSQSARRDRPFVEVVVAALSREESTVELFGQERGERIRYGLLEQASGGVLFLDEVADMDLPTQGRLLTALESQRLTRVGGSDPIPINVRVIAASQQDLETAVRNNQFRDDLYYRLSVVPLHIPPLREHLDDVAHLLRHYAEVLHHQEGLPLRRFSEAAQDFLSRYPWPGNVRELRNLVQRLLILGSGEQIEREEVERALSGRPTHEIELSDSIGLNLEMPLREAREAFERHYLLHQLERVEGNMTRLAEKVGVERTHLYRKLRTLGLDTKRSKEN
ncbi:sigma-54-dependent transcriptional regulator [Thiorhodospira sibirica]|uniref:sigma-54-dependent transcriptional regulator n=1 Tax=Thiorhodospira sibirica TaxID=154347 RepID=UPI00022C11BE|nr:sigma-54 dependent transcriptional regulator [Thiorhodospira sibirica]